MKKIVIPPLPEGFILCPGFEGYAVNAVGEVISCRYHKDHRWIKRKTHPIGSRTRRPNPVFYEGVILVKNDIRQFNTKVHTLVLEAFRGPCPVGKECRHLDGNSLNNRLDNLEWGTRKQNSDDKRIHGTMQSGERNGQAKLTREQVTQIRELRPFYTLVKLADKFHISLSQVKRILWNQSWIS